MVDSIQVNIEGPSGGEFAEGIVAALGDSLRSLSSRIKEQTDDTFMLVTIGVMTIAGAVFLWRRV